jgi:hypothetical protein
MAASLPTDAPLAAATRGVKRYGTTFGDQPARLFDAASYGNARATFFSESRGRLDAQPPGMARSLFSMEYGFGNVPPNAFAPVFSENEASVNPKIEPKGRQYHSLAHFVQGMAGTPAPGRFHLAALFRVSVDARRRNIGLHLQANDTPKSGADISRSLVTADATPSLAASPAVLNAVMAAMQMDLLSKNLAAAAGAAAAMAASAYARLTPLDLWFGPPAAAEAEALYGDADRAPKSLKDVIPMFAGFAWDGVVVQEEAVEGSSTSMNEGRRMLPGGMLSASGRGGAPATKLATVTHAGQAPMLDYFDGAGVTEGATLFAILRKFPAGTTGAGGGGAGAASSRAKLVYSLAQKLDDVIYGTSGEYTSQERPFELDIGARDNMIPISVDNDGYCVAAAGGEAVAIPGGAGGGDDRDMQVPFQPYEWGFYANPTGDRWVPPDVRRYTDEWGRVRDDALVVYLGRIVHAPIDAVYRPPATGETFRPLRSVMAALGKPVMQVILAGAPAAMLIN